MHWLDTTLLTLLGIGATLGFFSGLLWQIARLAAWGLGLWATIRFHEPAADLVRQHILRNGDSRLVAGVAYVLVFLAVYVSLLLGAALGKRMLEASGFNWLDRLLGALLGAAKSAAVLAGICMLGTRLSHPTVDAWLTQSKIAPALAQGMEQAMTLIPDDAKRDLAETLTQWRGKLDG